MDKEFLQSKIRQLIVKPWITEGDLMTLYTLLIALPLGPGVRLCLNQLAQDVDSDLKEMCIEGGGKNE